MSDRSSVAANIEQFLNLIWLPGEVRELRCPKYNKFGQTASGYFDNPSAMAKAAAAWDGKANLYVTLNPVAPSLIARAGNKVLGQAKDTTSDKDIISRKYLYLDIDPIRSSGISCTEAERESALVLLGAVTAYLSDTGWPDPITALSGNGYYALYQVDLPNTQESTRLVKGVLESLASLFNTLAVHIDTTVHNASRIAALIGTMKMKGENLPDRPHRRSKLLSVPTAISTASADMLKSVAGIKAQPVRTGLPTGAKSLRDTLDQQGIEYRLQPPDTNGVTWYHVRRCPFHEDGQDFECGIGQKLPDGPFAGKCFHPEGTGKGWREFKAALGITFGNGCPDQQQPIAGTAEAKYDGLRLTDTWNGRQLVSACNKDILWCEPLKHWFVYDGTRYACDNSREIERRAERAVIDLYTYAGTLPSREERQRMAEWATGCESRHRLSNMIESAKRMVPVRPEEFDRDPYLFNVINGTIDLRIQCLREHSREDRLTKRAEVIFDASASCSQWLAFLDRIFSGNQNIICFVQRLFGYGLLGLLTEHIMAILYGTGANGKSTLLGVLRSLLGEYAIHSRPEVFTAKRHESQGFELVALAGARVVTSSETSAGRRLDESLVKEMTGGEPIRCAPKYGDFFTFQPTFKPFLATNHKPQIQGVDEGIWRRVLLIPFLVTIPESERDRDLPAKLNAELPGILNWALEGTREFLRGGVQPPSEVRSATSNYRAEQDVLGSWIGEHCILASEAWDDYSALYVDYTRWCEENKEEPVKKCQFSASLDERGCASDRGTKGKRIRRGIELRSEVTR